MNLFEEHWRNVTRRTFLRRSGLGFGAIALGALNAASQPGPRTARGSRPPHFAPRAKRVIYLHMVGAPSQLDLFDHKPLLADYDGRPCPTEFIEGKRFAFLRGHPNIAASHFQFRRYGQSGAEFSELLPHLAGVADELAIVKSLQTDEFNHAPAQLFLHTGFGRPGRPAAGSWITYGLGSENQDLPAYVVMLSGPLAGAGTSLWSPGFLPSVYQGVRFRTKGDPPVSQQSPRSFGRRPTAGARYRRAPESGPA